MGVPEAAGRSARAEAALVATPRTGSGVMITVSAGSLVTGADALLADVVLADAVLAMEGTSAGPYTSAGSTGCVLADGARLCMMDWGAMETTIVAWSTPGMFAVPGTTALPSDTENARNGGIMR